LFEILWDTAFKSWVDRKAGFNFNSLNQNPCNPDASMSPDKFQQVQQACQGWKAHYELYDIQTDADPTRDFATTFDIDANEILLQLHQSLRWSIRSLKVNFPMAISEDLETVIILRTVLRFSFSESCRALETKIASALLWTDFDEKSQQQWSTERGFFGLPYFYGIAISADADYVILHDNSMGDLQVNLVAYQISSLETGLQTKVVNHILMKEPFDGDIQLVLHPHSHHALFISQFEVFLWRFDTGEHSIYLTPLSCF
jgi:hypothetical protein